MSTRLVSSLCILLLGVSLYNCTPSSRSETRILVFSKTLGWRHASIPAGIQLIEAIGKKQGWQVDTTENAANFTEENLKRYSAVIFLSTTGDVLDHVQQADFERYIQAGGGYVGIHAASDTEYGWPWYGRLVGAYFEGHPNNPNVRKATMRILDTEHESTRFLAGRDTWVREDEFYNFKDIYHGPADGIIPLIDIDETTYEGGTNPDFHPMTWYHSYDGGRAWYTNFGHTDETFEDADFHRLLTGGIRYAIGENRPLDYSKAHTHRTPLPHHFRKATLLTDLDEPTGMAILPDNSILWTQRKGALMMYTPADSVMKQVGNLSVWQKYEDGLVGVAADPDFEHNRWLYLYYAPSDSLPLFRLSRFQFDADTLLVNTEQVILTVPVQRQTCCHTGGSLAFGPDGLLYISTGDDTNPFETRYAPIDRRPGKEPWDASRSSGNPSDLRGKILRIRVHEDGSYSIPEGNLFGKEGKEGRPEVYVMGCRNPYRISVDSQTGYLYWGDVGPDGRVDSVHGPRGYDEINQARKAGFFGWPFFIGDNYAYTDVDFATQTLGEAFDPEAPFNDSPYNQGTQQLPKPQPAFIWYPYVDSKQFPEVGSGGRNAMAGPVYHLEEFEHLPNHFPAYFDDKLFVYDFMRDWVLVVSMNEAGDRETLEPFLSKEQMGLSSPMDMKFGPDGALYVLEYGTKWFSKNPDARLVRFYYDESNQAPLPDIQMDYQVGAAPLKVQFSAAGTRDLDPGDKVSYRWLFPDGTEQTSMEAAHVFDNQGIHTVTLEASDNYGNAAQQTVEIWVGNSPPQLSLDLAGNQDFFWQGRKIAYSISVDDAEEGNAIVSEALSVSWDWVPNQYDPTESAQGHQALASRKTPQALIKTYGCFACHNIDSALIGPSYLDVAKRYEKDRKAVTYLPLKIRQGGSGIWGGNAMPAMPQVSEAHAQQLAQYILSLGKPNSSLPAQGTVRTDRHEGIGAGGMYILQASYQDQGANGIGPLADDLTHILRPLQFSLLDIFDPVASKQSRKVVKGQTPMVELGAGGYVATQPIDLTDLQSIHLTLRGESPVELRLDSPEGPIVGLFDPSDANSSLALDTQVASGRHTLVFVPVKEATSAILLSTLTLTN